MLMIALPGTLIYIRNFQTNYKSFRTSAFDFACTCETDLTFGLESLRQSIGFQLELDLNKMSQPIFLNTKIN